MEQSIQSRTNGVAFRQPTFDFNRITKRIFGKIVRGLEYHGRAQAAKALVRHGYHAHAKSLLEGYRR